MTVHKIIRDLEAAKAKYLQADKEEAPRSVVREASQGVKKLQANLVDAIVEGADPCPTCGESPHGMMQPRGDGNEFEIGCLNCGWFKHTDGTARMHAARGGLLPKHTVEAWNAGVDFWKKKVRERFSDKEWDSLKTVDEWRALAEDRAAKAGA